MCAAGCGIVMALADTIQNRLSGQFRHQKTGQTTDRAKQSRARIAGPGTPLMPIRIGNDTNPIAKTERILNQPFKRAPTGMHFHGFFKPAVMRQFNISIAATTMRKHDNIIFVIFGKSGK